MSPSSFLHRTLWVGLLAVPASFALASRTPYHGASDAVAHAGEAVLLEAWFSRSAGIQKAVEHADVRAEIRRGDAWVPLGQARTDGEGRAVPTLPWASIPAGPSSSENTAGRKAPRRWERAFRRNSLAGGRMGSHPPAVMVAIRLDQSSSVVSFLHFIRVVLDTRIMPRSSASSDGLSYKGWVRPGPVPLGGIGLEPGETLDGLCGHWRIFQLEKGHRFSVDDLVTAWYGTTWCPRAGCIADLGSGIGSVALVAAWRCPGAVVHTVEAQEPSFRLAQKSIHYNGQASRVFPRLGDLRDPALFEDEAPFDLVLGSPPYWPEGHRLPAAHPQTVPARLEVRGSIADYARAAARILAPGGLFACVFPNDQRDRALAALGEAGLLCLHRREIIFKEGEPYGLDVYAAARRRDLPGDFETKAQCPEVEPPILIRRADGSVDPGIARVRLAVGFPPGL